MIKLVRSILRKIFRGKKPSPIVLFFETIKSFIFQNNLKYLSLLYKSDKWGCHFYAQWYEKHFQHFRKKKMTILEIGVGGYSDATAGGASLKMWERFFPNALIVGIDIHDKSHLAKKRIKIYQGDQSDEKFLQKVVTEIGKPFIIFDDGSHQNEHVVKSFEVLFPLLADNGIYVIEDTQTSYWPEYGGTSERFDNVKTSMCFFKKLVDGLNYEEFKRTDYVPTYFDKNIVSIHFYHNLVLIQKGLNNEGSNILGRK